LMSLNAQVRSSSKTIFEGISPAIILQNKQGMMMQLPLPSSYLLK
jgi:hypothetical protein